jgi:hypothetical protein
MCEIICCRQLGLVILIYYRISLIKHPIKTLYDTFLKENLKEAAKLNRFFKIITHYVSAAI